MLVMQEVSGKYFVHGNRPEGAVVEIAEMLVLPFRRPRRLDVGDVVERAQRARLEGSWRPHARKRPAVETRRRRDLHRRTVRNRDDALAVDEVDQVRELLLRDRNQLSRRWMILFGAGPGRKRIAAIHS